MKFKWRFWSGLTFAVVVLAWCVLSYNYMWPPIVRNIKWEHRLPTENSCVNSLRQIDGAISEWALENNKHNGDRPTFDEIKPYVKLNSKGDIPSCPQGGKYTINGVGAIPQVTCSLDANSSPTRIRVDHFYWEGTYHRLP
jgi:hypothetical protein